MRPNFYGAGHPHMGQMIVNSDADALVQNSFNTQIFLQDQVDVQHTPIYDTVSIAANAPLTEALSFFFTNVGPQASKGQNLTNMTQQQKLPAPEAFAIFSFRFKWNENAYYPDLITLTANFAYNFFINSKSYNRAPLWHYNAGGGINAAGLITSTTAGLTQLINLTSSTNGQPGRHAMHKLALTIALENQVTFAASLLGTNFTTAASGAGGTGLILVSLLDGLYARAIQ